MKIRITEVHPDDAYHESFTSAVVEVTAEQLEKADTSHLEGWTALHTGKFISVEAGENDTGLEPEEMGEKYHFFYAVKFEVLPE